MSLQDALRRFDVPGVIGTVPAGLVMTVSSSKL